MHGPNEQDDPMLDEQEPQVIGSTTGRAFKRQYDVEISRRVRQTNTVTVWASSKALAMAEALLNLEEIDSDTWVDDNEFVPSAEVISAEEQ